MLSPAPAVAADPPGSPSAPELWNEYPLHPRTASPPALPLRPATRTGQPADAARSAGGASDAALVALVAVAGAGAALLAARRRRRRPARAAVATGHVFGVAAWPATAGGGAALWSSGPRRPGAGGTPDGRPPPSPPPGGAGKAAPSEHERRADPPARGARPARASPPDPGVAWTAELEWGHRGDESRFQAVARQEDTGEEAIVAHTAPLTWPPTGPDAVQALTDAARALETALLAGGWEPLPRGAAWYAKRFAWSPVSVPLRAPDAPAGSAPPPPADDEEAAPARRRAAQPAGAATWPRPVAWPPDSERLWCCEITWDAGYVKSRFRAVASPPGASSMQAVAASRVFKWRFMEGPDARMPDQVTAVQHLAVALRIAGWTLLGRGDAWYALRFVWRAEGEPPEHVEMPAATGGTTD